MSSRRSWQILPRPDRLHHTVEDFLTTWDAPNSHLLPLRRFLESVINRGRGADSRTFFADTCLVAALTHSTVPPSCAHRYLDTADRPAQGLERPIPPPTYPASSSRASDATVTVSAALMKALQAGEFNATAAAAGGTDHHSSLRENIVPSSLV